MRTPQPRPGFTLLELMLVLLLLIILAAVTLPSFAGLRGNAHQKAAADLVKGQIAEARGLAMQEGTAYRLAVHTDGIRVRLAPDTADFGDAAAARIASGNAKTIEQKLDKATAAVTADAEDSQPTADAAGWITVATFLPDGTCREDYSILEVREPEFPPIRLRLRGVTGTARVMPTQIGTTPIGGVK